MKESASSFCFYCESQLPNLGRHWVEMRHAEEIPAVEHGGVVTGQLLRFCDVDCLIDYLIGGQRKRKFVSTKRALALAKIRAAMCAANCINLVEEQP